MSCKKIPWTSTTFHSAIHFRSFKTQIIEIEFICSYVFFEFNLYNVSQKQPFPIDDLLFSDCFWVFQMTNYRDWIYLFLCFSLNSISLLFHKMFIQRSTTYCSAIVFGSFKWQIIEIEFICSYVFLWIQSLFCSIKCSFKGRRLSIQRFILGLPKDKL